MSVLTSYSYDHPRRTRAFTTSADRARRPLADESMYPDTRLTHIEDSISRLEMTLNDKLNTLFTRMEKCSDLSIASSRAVAAISSQFDGLKSDVEQKMIAINSSLSDVRASTNRLCLESQNLTMTALEDCCSELMKQIKANADGISKWQESHSQLESDLKSIAGDMSDELKAAKNELVSVSKRVDENSVEAMQDDMRLIAEECVNVGLTELNEKLISEMDVIDADWRSYRAGVDSKLEATERKISELDRLDELRQLFEERIKGVKSSVLLETRNGYMEAVDVAKSDIELRLDEMTILIDTHSAPIESEPPDLRIIESLSGDIRQVESVMTTFAASTVPSLYREMDTKIAHCEYQSQQVVLELLKEFAADLECDIDRMVELIHSVFVHSGVPMPAGTTSSWKRFREVVFDKENIGGVRVRRPILGENHTYLTPRVGRSNSVKRSR